MLIRAQWTFAADGYPHPNKNTNGRSEVHETWGKSRTLALLAHSRRLASGYERLPATIEGIHFCAFAFLMLTRLMGDGS